MKIVLVGSGTVGRAICGQLVNEGHNVTVIDRDENALADLSNTYDVVGIVGNCADVSVLKKADVEHAALVIAAASEDETNILCCAASKKMGALHTVARVRNPEYYELIRLMKNDMNLSMTINPEYMAAKEISRILRYPSAAKLDTFCRGRVELVQLDIDDKSPLCDITLNQFRTKSTVRFLVCGVLRENEIYIPSGDFVIKSGDRICVAISDEDIVPFFKLTGDYIQPIKNVIIFGGGRITYYLQAMLEKEHIHSKIIEKDKERCREFAEQYDCEVIRGNGTDQNLLLSAGVEKADAMLALSDVDEENAIVSMFAKTMKVKKVITMIKTMSFIDFFKSAGLESIISPRQTTAAMVLRYVRALNNSFDSAEIESLHKIMDGGIEALEFLIKEDIKGITGIPLKELKSKKGVLIACIVHPDRVVIPSGGDVINAGDTVIVVSGQGQLNNIKDILE